MKTFIILLTSMFCLWVKGFEFTDVHGTQISTRGINTMILVGNSSCPAFDHMITNVIVRLKRDYEFMPIIILLTENASGSPEQGIHWQSRTPEGNNLCVVGMWIGSLFLTNWYVNNELIPQYGGFIYDQSERCVMPRWGGYKQRWELEPTIAKLTTQISIRQGNPTVIYWPVVPMAPQLEFSLDLHTWHRIPTGYRQEDKFWRVDALNEPKQFYRLVWP